MTSTANHRKQSNTEGEKQSRKKNKKKKDP